MHLRRIVLSVLVAIVLVAIGWTLPRYVYKLDDMKASDVIAVLNIVSNVLTVMAAPIIALWVSSKLQERATRKQQKLDILSLLLAQRHQPLSPETFKALNLIDVVFVDDGKVRDAWMKYYNALSDGNLNNPVGWSMREEKRRELLMSITTAVGLADKISTVDLIRTYAPDSVVEVNHLEVWERIKRREDLRSEFIERGIGFPDYIPVRYPIVPPQQPVSPPAAQPVPQADPQGDPQGDPNGPAVPE